MSWQTDHFSLEELIQTDTGLYNVPPEHIERVLYLQTVLLLEPFRAEYGITKSNSSYRSHEVNTRVGGHPDSQHMRGEATDLRLPGREDMERPLETPFDWIVTASGIPFGTVIYYRRGKKEFIHMALPRPNRPMGLAYTNFDGVKKEYKP